MSHSQNAEEAIIKNFFGRYKGALLSIGENDGQTFSNAYALIKFGWSAVLVEPARRALDRLYALHSENQSVVICDFAIGTENGEQIFSESLTPLTSNNDTSLVSTLVPVEKERWKTINMQYDNYPVHVRTFEKFMEWSPLKKFDFISIDTEGLNYEVLRQIPLDKLGTKAVIVEWNSRDQSIYHSYLSRHGFRFLHRNPENLIYVR